MFDENILTMETLMNLLKFSDTIIYLGTLSQICK